MKAVLTEESTPVYASLDDQTISITTIHKGEIVDLGKVTKKKNKEVWVAATLENGTKGYIHGDAKIYRVQKGQLTDKSIDMVDAPSKDAVVLKTLVKGAIITITAVEKNDDGSWYHGTDETGATGYIPSSAGLRVAPEFTSGGARKDMITGLVFIVVGAVLAFLDTRNNQSSGMVFLSYAVIFFGILQGGQGLYEYLIVRKKEKEKQG
jgi:uncharacterized protein YgiM (DUF1202 family)